MIAKNKPYVDEYIGENGFFIHLDGPIFLIGKKPCVAMRHAQIQDPDLCWMGKASTNENYRFLVTLVILLAHF
jgi:hypothetical protein